ncbi:hypothetical protein BGZ81_001861 [Podila clonocystis]|nr:hypothetical protein BGZ81_001861 [Podila clonocystis]
MAQFAQKGAPVHKKARTESVEIQSDDEKHAMDQDKPEKRHNTTNAAMDSYSGQEDVSSGDSNNVNNDDNMFEIAKKKSKVKAAKKESKIKGSVKELKVKNL